MEELKRLLWNYFSGIKTGDISDSLVKIWSERKILLLYGYEYSKREKLYPDQVRIRDNTYVRSLVAEYSLL
jgi:hypothetical protein